MNEVISGLQGAKEYNGKRGKVVVREIKSAAQSLRLYQRHLSKACSWLF